MKVAVINLSGNVGKTSVTEHLLKPRLKDAKVFSIESINQGVSGEDIEHMRGKMYGELIDELILLEDAIVDIGSSNVEDFLKLMELYDGSQEEFDFFIVPTVKERKVITDTIKTIMILGSLGVPKEKIRLVFNKIDTDDSVIDDFSSLFGFAKAEDKFIINEECTIYLNEIFERLSLSNKTLGEITTDDTDYRAKLRKAKSDEEKQLCVRMIALKRLSGSANRNLDTVFNSLFD